MTKQDKWLPYVRQIADLMGLKDWEFEVKESDPGEENGAAVDSIEGRRKAWVELSDEFDTYEPERQRYIIVHEMTHIPFEPAWKFTEKLLSPDSERAYRLLMEYGTDGIATVIAPFMPLPSQVQKKKV